MIRGFGHGQKPDSKFAPGSIDDIARSAHTASSLVFLVVESPQTYQACRAIVSSISSAQSLLRDHDSYSADGPWSTINSEIAGLLREFQAAAREELGIVGVDRSQILDRSNYRSK